MPLNLDICFDRSLWGPTDEERFTAWIMNDKGKFEEEISSIKVSKCSSEKFNRRVQKFDEVEAVGTHDRLAIIKIPTNLTAFFPNVWALYISNCGLKSISRNDLKGLEKLKEIVLKEMDIEELPDNLFKDLINLEQIELQSNKIKFIGRGVFDGLQNLKFVDLRKNPSVNLVYADKTSKERFGRTKRFSELDNLNKFFDEVFPRANPEVRRCYVRVTKAVTPAVSNPSKRPRNSAQETSNALENSNGRSQDQPGPSGFKPQTDINKNLTSDILKIFNSADFKDLTIKIGEHEIKVHKLMLAARSPKLAEMIKQNPGADELILDDIEVEIFKIILDYIYEEKIPENYDDNSVKVLVAAANLKIESLKIKVEKILLEVVDPGTALAFLNLATKYDCKELKRKAFEEFKKTF